MKSSQTVEKPKLSVGLEFTFVGVDLGAFYTIETSNFWKDAVIPILCFLI